MGSASIITPIKIDAARTAWVFVADSTEPRHIYDVVFAATALRGRGVANANIFVCTDYVGAAQHLDAYDLRNRHSLADLDTVIGQLACEVVVLVVGGHGNPAGIGSPLIFSPAALLAKVRAIKGLQAGIVVLTQCFAGVFNYLDARSQPPLVLIGATALNNSISTSITLPKPIPQADGTDGLHEWAANLFSAHFFQWFSARQDVDGDGALTVMDAYKFAGVHSNRQLISIKSRAFVSASTLTQKLMDLARQVDTDKKAGTNTLDAAMRRLDLDATEKALLNQLNTIYLHQEPWILSADLARHMILDI